MGYALLDPQGHIKTVVTKLSPFMKVLEGERIVSHDMPQFDAELETCVVKEPVAADCMAVEFIVQPKSGVDINAVATKRFSAHVQARLDAAARSLGYDSIISACSYATSSHPVYGAQGRYFTQWRDACWQSLFDLIDQGLGLQYPLPSLAQLDAALPPFDLPVASPTLR